MLFTWENYYSTNCLNVQDNENWRLYAELDETGMANLYLIVGNQFYFLTDADEILEGRETMLLDTYDVFEYYTALVLQVSKMVAEQNVRNIYFEEIKNELLSTYWWPKWSAEGRVTDNYWNP